MRKNKSRISLPVIPQPGFETATIRFPVQGFTHEATHTPLLLSVEKVYIVAFVEEVCALPTFRPSMLTSSLRRKLRQTNKNLYPSSGEIYRA